MDITLTPHSVKRAHERSWMSEKDIRFFVKLAWNTWVKGESWAIHWEEPVYKEDAEFWVPVTIDSKPYFIVCTRRIWDHLIVKTVIPVETRAKLAVWRKVKERRTRSEDSKRYAKVKFSPPKEWLEAA